VETKELDSIDDEELVDFYKNDMKTTDPLEKWKLKNLCAKAEDKVRILKNDINLIRLHNRMIANQPIPFLNQNGCCIPGSRRLYITTKGKFKVCERIGKSPYMGDVDNGIVPKLVEEYYIKNYTKASIKDCSNCWAAHLCSLCYISFYDENGINIEKKRKICHAQRCSSRNDLIMYHQLLESNPEYILRISKDVLA